MSITRTRHPNVLAAQWSANGGALCTTDLTQPDADVFGANVFGANEQRERLSPEAYERLQQTLRSGQPLDTSLADWKNQSVSVLPVNLGGLALLLFGVALMIAEAFMPGFSVVGFGGIVAFVLGALAGWINPDLAPGTMTVVLAFWLVLGVIALLRLTGTVRAGLRR